MIFWFFEVVKPPQSWKNIYFSLFKVYNSPIKIHGPWISKNLGTFIFENSWTMIFGNSWSLIFKSLMNYVFQFIYFCDKKREKTFIILIQSILFSNGRLHREKKFLFREILIIFFLGGVFFKFHWSMPQWNFWEDNISFCSFELCTERNL